MPRLVDISTLPTFTAVDLQSDLGAKPGKVVIPFCVQIVLNWSQADGKNMHVVWYGRSASVPAPTVAQADAIFAALSTSASYTALKAQFATASSFTGLTLKSVHVPDQALVSSTGAAVPGTAAGSQMPNEVAAVVTLRTAQAGRAFRGRSYIGNWTSASIDTGNVILAAHVTLLQNWANSWIGAVNAGGTYTFVLGQRERNAYTSPKTGATFPHRDPVGITITQAVVRDNHWDSQRRRGLR